MRSTRACLAVAALVATLIAGTAFSAADIFRIGEQSTAARSAFLIGSELWLFSDHAGLLNVTKYDSTGSAMETRDLADLLGGWVKSSSRTSDGGFLLSGLRMATPQDAFVLKLGPTLETEWMRVFAGSDHIWPGSARELAGGGYVVPLRETGGLSLLRLDAFGRLVWKRTLDVSGQGTDTDAFDVVETTWLDEAGVRRCGGLVVVGAVKTSQDWDVLVVGLSCDGNSVQWQRLVGGAKEEGSSTTDSGGIRSATSNLLVREDRSGLHFQDYDLLFATSTASVGSNGGIAFVPFRVRGGERLDPAPTFGTIRLLDGGDADYVFGPNGGDTLIRTAGGRIVLGGGTKSVGAGDSDILLVALDTNLLPVWMKTYGTSDAEGVLGLVEDRQTGKLILAGTNATGDYGILLTTGADGAASTTCLTEKTVTLKVQDSALGMTAPGFPLRLGSSLSTMTVPEVSYSTAFVRSCPATSTTTPKLYLSKQTVDFGGLATCAGVEEQPILLSNRGGGFLVVTEASIAGGDQGPFDLLGSGARPCQLPAVLAPLEGCELATRFYPTSLGAKSGEINVASNDPSGPLARIALVGEGVACCTPKGKTEVPSRAQVGTPVWFKASQDAGGCPEAPSFEWDFGDQTPAVRQAVVAHQYETAGSFTWRLSLTANGVSSTQTGVVEVSSAPPDVLVLSSGRVWVSVTFRNQYSGQTGIGQPLPQKNEFGFFHFADPNNPEVFVKVLDFGADRPYLLFAAGLTDFQYTVRFQNVATGKLVSWTKPAGAFDGFVNTVDLSQGTEKEGAGTTSLADYGLALDTMIAAARMQLKSTLDELSLSRGRVKVTVTWRNQYDGTTGTAKALPKKDEFGFFYFTDPNNPEVFVKALDFGSDRAFLLFYCGLTDFEYTVTFTNVCTGVSWSQTKAAGATNGGANTTTMTQNGCTSGPLSDLLLTSPNGWSGEIHHKGYSLPSTKSCSLTVLHPAL